MGKKSLSIRTRIWMVFGAMLLVSMVTAFLAFSVIKEHLLAQQAFDLAGRVEGSLFRQGKGVWQYIAGDLKGEAEFNESLEFWHKLEAANGNDVNQFNEPIYDIITEARTISEVLIEDTDFFNNFSESREKTFEAIGARTAVLRAQTGDPDFVDGSPEHLMIRETFRNVNDENLILSKIDLGDKSGENVESILDRFLKKHEAATEAAIKAWQIEIEKVENTRLSAELRSLMEEMKDSINMRSGRSSEIAETIDAELIADEALRIGEFLVIHEEVGLYAETMIDLITTYQKDVEPRLDSLIHNVNILKNNIAVKTANQARVIAIMFGLGMGLIFLLVILGTYISSILVINPIHEAKDAAIRIAEGNFNKRIKVINDDEIGDLATAFNKMTRNLKEKTRLIDEKNEFMALFLHQIRSPITAIKWYNEFLLENKKKHFTKTEKEYLNNIRVNGEHLSQLAQQFLHTNSLEQGKLQINNVEKPIKSYLEGLLKDLAPSLKSYDAKVKLKFKGKSMPNVLVDENLTYQVFQNIILNAAKYGGKKPKVEITVSVENRFCVVAVKDSGMGIPEKDKKNIFQKLFRASNATKALSGNGLGLYLAKMIMDKAGGDISFKSSRGRGTTFFISLPIAKKKK